MNKFPEKLPDIYVGNLDYATTKEQIQKLFETVGPVVRVRMRRDKNTGKPRNFAFVQMVREADVAKAIAKLEGKPLDGRPLNVSIANEKPEPRQGPALQIGPRRSQNEGSDKARSAFKALFSR